MSTPPQIPNLHAIDAFCGAGGWSIAIKRAGGQVHVAVNHDPKAIEAHAANFPDTIHMNDDIRQVKMADIAAELRRRGVRYVCISWSAECTHFSGAKGGATRERDSRMLSEDLIRWILELQREGITVLFVFVENVMEFLTWCPVRPCRKDPDKGLHTQEERFTMAQIAAFDAVAIGDDTMRMYLNEEMDSLNRAMVASGLYQLAAPEKLKMLPDRKTKGVLYKRWHQWIEGMGYEYEWRQLNAADYGAYQSRKRYFGISKHKSIAQPIQWPQQTHTKKPGEGSGLLKWKPCREILDMDDRGPSIFTGREGMAPLVESTCARIEYGINRFPPEVDAFVDRTHTGAEPADIEGPLPTVRATYGNGLVSAKVRAIDNHTHNTPLVPIDNPLPTCMASRDKYLLTACIVPGNYSNPAAPLHGPLPTLLASRHHHSLCQAFIDNQYGTNGRAVGCSSVDAPLGALTTNPKHCLITPFIENQYSSAGAANQVSSILNPLWAVTTFPKQRIVTPVITKHYSAAANVSSCDSPLGTVTPKDRFALVQADMTPMPTGKYIFRSMPWHAVSSTGNVIWPAFGKTRIIPVRNRGVVIGGYEVDRRIHDIHYRMLKVSELRRAQGFPEDYILNPTSETESKKRLGNAVQADLATQVVLAQIEAFRALETVTSNPSLQFTS